MVTAEALTSTIQLKCGSQYGTAILSTVAGKQVLITARHLLSESDKECAKAKLEYSFRGKWHAIETERLMIQSHVPDLAIYTLSKEIRTLLPIDVGMKSIYLSQDVYILGYPFGTMYSAMGGDGFLLPVVKKGILATLPIEPGLGFYVDALNNEGFSGGPIVFRDSTTNKLKIAGIVSKWKEEFVGVLEDAGGVRGEAVGHAIPLNTGLLVGYALENALEAVRVELERIS